MIKLKYKSFPGLYDEPSGSNIPVLAPVLFAIILISFGLNCGSENIHFIFLSSTRSFISAICFAPGWISVLILSAPNASTPNLFSKYW